MFGVLLDRVDQVLGHRRRETVAADEDPNGAGVAGEMERRLPRRVAAADDVDAFAGQRLGLRHRCAVVDARAFELGQAGLQPPVLDPEREHDCKRGDLGAAFSADDVPSVARLEPRRAVGEAELRAEQPGLLVRALGQLAAAEAAGKAEVVADQRARAGLAADVAASSTVVRSPSEAP